MVSDSSIRCQARGERTASKLYAVEVVSTKPDYRKALPLLLLEANRGNGYASYDIGRMYLLGQGCEQDEAEAQRWFMDALEAFQRAEATAQKKPRRREWSIFGG